LTRPQNSLRSGLSSDSPPNSCGGGNREVGRGIAVVRMPMIRKHAVMLRTGSCPLFERFILYNNFVRNGGKPLKELHVAPLIWNFMEIPTESVARNAAHVRDRCFFCKKSCTYSNGRPERKRNKGRVRSPILNGRVNAKRRRHGCKGVRYAGFRPGPHFVHKL